MQDNHNGEEKEEICIRCGKHPSKCGSSPFFQLKFGRHTMSQECFNHDWTLVSSDVCCSTTLFRNDITGSHIINNPTGITTVKNPIVAKCGPCSGVTDHSSDCSMCGEPAKNPNHPFQYQPSPSNGSSLARYY